MKERVKVIFPDWRGGPLVLVSQDVGPNLPIRNYPAGHYVQVISGILEQSHEARVLLIGVPENTPVCEKICCRGSLADPIDHTLGGLRNRAVPFRQ